MSANLFTMAFDNITSDAQFRTWVAILIAQIDAIPGWTRASDTGQINTSTAVRSNNVLTNYAVWRTDDGLSNIYVRLDFTNPGGGASYAGLGVEVGFSTNGAGTITGTQTTGRIGMLTNVSNETAVRNSIISGAAGRLSFAIGLNATNLTSCHLFSIERSRDAAGVTTADGVLVFGGGGNGSFTPNGFANWLYLPTSGGVPTMESRGTAILTNSSSTVFGTTVALSPIIPLAGSAQNPGVNLLAYHNTDFTRDSQVTVSIYGVNRNYYIIGPNWPSQVGCGGTAYTNGRLAMVYE